MKIGIFSDLHLDFYPDDVQERILSKLMEEAKGVDVLVNGGDTHHTPRARDRFNDFMADVCPNYIETMGNHDYYGDVFLGTVSKFEPTGSTEKFLHGTMWTNFRNRDPDVIWCAERSVSDFRRIFVPVVHSIPSRPLATHMAEAHDAFIEVAIEYRPTVVVSHFAPAVESVHPKYVGELLNGYFVNDDGEVIRRIEPKLWIHGHCHDPMDYTLGSTRVVSNPLGYPRETYKTPDDYSLKVIEI